MSDIIDIKTKKHCDPLPVMQFVSLTTYNELLTAHNNLVKHHNELVDAHNRLFEQWEKLEIKLKAIETKETPTWLGWWR